MTKKRQPRTGSKPGPRKFQTSGLLSLVATCGLGLEELLEAELRELSARNVRRRRAAVTFHGTWKDAYRANYRLRTANRVLLELGSWDGREGDELARGAGEMVTTDREWDGLRSEALFRPERSFAVRATSSRSRQRDARWVALKVKDGIVDAQRKRYGQRASVEKGDPDLQLRLFLHEDRATLLLDLSGDSLDRRGYRVVPGSAPVREQIAAACVLASGWTGKGSPAPVVVDPMCGSGTLLAEAGAGPERPPVRQRLGAGGGSGRRGEPGAGGLGRDHDPADRRRLRLRGAGRPRQGIRPTPEPLPPQPALRRAAGPGGRPLAPDRRPAEGSLRRLPGGDPRRHPGRRPRPHHAPGAAHRAARSGEERAARRQDLVTRRLLKRRAPRERLIPGTP